MDVDEQINTIDTTAGADTDESHITGTKSCSISATFLCNGTAGSAIAAALATGSSGTLTWGPLGTAAGMPKYSCIATVASNNDSYPYDGEVEFDVEFTKNGDWISNYKHSGSTY
ncbi:MAG: hypothetical protein GX616_05440 [Planctomycetes bacterium]|nr:hypothetical protein [Planctomycetota bacterium]